MREKENLTLLGNQQTEYSMDWIRTGSSLRVDLVLLRRRREALRKMRNMH